MIKFKAGDIVVRTEGHPDNGWVAWCRKRGLCPEGRLHISKCAGGWVEFSGVDTERWGQSHFTLVQLDNSEDVFKPADDTVRNPSRYMLFPDVESIQIIARSFTVEEFRGFCLGNVLKYRLRAGKKDKVEQELAKADFYKELFERHKGECRAG